MVVLDVCGDVMEKEEGEEEGEEYLYAPGSTGSIIVPSEQAGE